MTTPPSDPAARAWLNAARSPVAAKLEAIYAEAAKRINERGPACWASGRCCNFESFGHRLYTTGLEAAYCVAKWNHANPRLTIEGVDAALSRGGCPFQQRNLCNAHTIKPLGCRVFFCDRTATEWQHTLLEDLHAKVKALHSDDIPYEYAEWRWMLGRLATAS